MPEHPEIDIVSRIQADQDSGEDPTPEEGLPVLFGEIAVAEGMITGHQLAVAIRQQKTSADPFPLGEILVRNRSILPEDLHRALEIQGRRLNESRDAGVHSLEEDLFARNVIELRLASEDEVNAARRIQARCRKAGQKVRLGQVLIECGTLTLDQARRLLREQRDEIVFCPSCYVQYSVAQLKPGQSILCRSCNKEFTVPDPNHGDPFNPPTVNAAPGGGTVAPWTAAFTNPASQATGPTQTQSGELKEKEFGDYRILKRIARGGMGIVYQAVQKKLDRIVALKVLTAGKGASEEDLRRFHQEATAAANLNHPDIVQIHDIGEVDGRPYLTMDFVKGHPLSWIIRKRGLSTREALIVTMRVAEGLQHAHSKGIVHRDIKPQNILIDQQGNPRITDFGIVKDLGSDSKLTQTGEVIGTPLYMSPEQAAVKKDLDGRADVYSLGAILYELLTSKPPFMGESSVEILMKVVRDEPRPPRSLNPSIHKDLETICLKCLEKLPDKRYESAKELQRDIERYLNGEAIQARPIGWAERFWRKVLRNKGASISAAAAILVVLGVSGFFITSKSRDIRALRETVTAHIEKGRKLLAVGDPQEEGLSLMTVEELQEARVEFEKALALDPESRAGHYGLADIETREILIRNELIRDGQALFREGKNKDAKDKFLSALRIDDVSEEALRGLEETEKALVEEGTVGALRRESQGLLEEGLAGAKEARAASLEEADRKYVDAIILIRQAVAKDPAKDLASSESRKALTNLLLEFATVTVKKNSFEMASFLLSEAALLEADSGLVEALQEEIDQQKQIHDGYTRFLKDGKERLAQGDYGGAIPAIRQALEIVETEEAKTALSQARYLKGMTEGDAHALAERWDEALRAYRIAVENADDRDREEATAKHAGARKKVCRRMIAEANDARTARENSRAEEILAMVLQIDPEHRLARTMLTDLEGTEQAPAGKIYVPGGEFSIASDLSNQETIIASFYIDRYEVTNQQYSEFIADGGYQKEELWDAKGWEHITEFISRDGAPGPLRWSRGAYPTSRADHPVSGICWYEARAFARWKGERLPIEIEWEKAASADGTGRRKYPWGDEWDPSFADFGSRQTQAVGENDRDVSLFGIRDLAGGVNEWTVGEGEIPTVKGASYLYPLERYARCSFRGMPGPLYRSPGTGFRCVREIGTGDRQ